MKKIMTMVSMMCAMAVAEDKQEQTVFAGPHGGKLLEAKPLPAEFQIMADGKVAVTFYSEDRQPVPPTEQTVRITAQAPGGNSTFVMEKNENGFLSTESLPEGDGYNIVVQIKASPDGSFQNFRVPYSLEICPECSRSEYACICDHAGAGH